MKKILLIVLLFASSFAGAQKDFEGTIKYDLNYTGEGIDQMAAFMPIAYTYTFKGRKMKMETEGGMVAAMMGEILMDNEKGMAYVLNHAEKTAYTMKNDDGNSEGEMPKITALDEEIKIEGYTCKKYLVEVEQAEQAMKTIMWVTEDIQIKKPKKNKQVNMGAAFVDGMKGFPLKIVTTMDAGGMSMTMTQTATKVEEKKVDNKEVSVPEGYTEKEFDQSMFMKGF